MLLAARQTFRRRVTPLEWIGMVYNRSAPFYTGARMTRGGGFGAAVSHVTASGKTTGWVNLLGTSWMTGNRRAIFYVCPASFNATNAGWCGLDWNTTAGGKMFYIYGESRVHFECKKKNSADIAIYKDGKLVTYKGWFDFDNNNTADITLNAEKKIDARLYGVWVYGSGGQTIYDAVPARRGSEVGLWDRVTRTFRPATGYTAGPKGGSLHA